MDLLNFENIMEIPNDGKTLLFDNWSKYWVEQQRPGGFKPHWVALFEKNGYISRVFYFSIFVLKMISIKDDTVIPVKTEHGRVYHQLPKDYAPVPLVLTIPKMATLHHSLKS